MLINKLKEDGFMKNRIFKFQGIEMTFIPLEKKAPACKAVSKELLKKQGPILAATFDNLKEPSKLRSISPEVQRTLCQNISPTKSLGNKFDAWTQDVEITQDILSKTSPIFS